MTLIKAYDFQAQQYFEDMARLAEERDQAVLLAAWALQLAGSLARRVEYTRFLEDENDHLFCILAELDRELKEREL